jgi:hypothetical protein
MARRRIASSATHRDGAAGSPAHRHVVMARRRIASSSARRDGAPPDRQLIGAS